MRIRLMESKRTRQSSVGATAASVLVHVAVIGVAAYATLGATPTAAPAVTAPRVIYVPTEVHPLTNAGGHREPPRPCAPLECLPLPRAPIVETPVSLPTVDPVTAGPPIEFPVDGIAGATAGAGKGAPDGTPLEIAEVPATALAGNPLPVYPALLRTTNVHGIVNARFVVDTSGRVEPPSITFDGESDRLFQEAVRRALLGSRFHPAMNAGRRVRMLVRQDFVFRLTS